MNSQTQGDGNANIPVAERLVWIDALKGIGILAVVSAHIYSGGIPRIIYIFHMPLFFFIGGYLLRRRANLKKFAIDKAQHLLVPYVCFLLIVYPIQLYFQFYENSDPFTSSEILRILAAPVIGGKMLAGPAAVFWFTTCFFFSQQIMNFLLVKYNHRTILRWMLALIALAYCNSLFFPRFWLPGNINVACAAVPLFYAGHLLGEGRWRPTRGQVWLALTMSLVSAVLIYYQLMPGIDMKNAAYGVPAITVAFSIAWIVTLIAIAKAVARIMVVGSILREIGMAAMVIMYAHQSIQLLMPMNLGITNTSIRFCAAVGISYLIYRLALQFPTTRFLLLGLRDKDSRV